MVDADKLGPGESDRALLILDMTLDRFRGPDAVPGAHDIVRFVQGELRYFRERARPVVFALQAAEKETPVIQELTPRTDEHVLRKPSPSAFFGTDLFELLCRQRVRRLTIVGLETHTSVLLTAADALSHGLEVVVPDPCVAARDFEAHRFALRLLRKVWPHTWPARAPSTSSDGDRPLAAS